jgi:dTDP-4-dehydrorhamnose 3,5-epimerase-like enzyme
MNYTLSDVQLVDLPVIPFRAGNISPIENGKEIPFEIKRIFYLFDIPGGESRGAHAHRECWQFLIAASGSFNVVADDGKTQSSYFLNRPNRGLLIPPGIWASETDFSSGAVCLVLASHLYDASDYIRNYPEYLQERNLC